MYRAQKTKKWCHILALNFKDEKKILLTVFKDQFKNDIFDLHCLKDI